MPTFLSWDPNDAILSMRNNCHQNSKELRRPQKIIILYIHLTFMKWMACEHIFNINVSWVTERKAMGNLELAEYPAEFEDEILKER